MLALRRSRHFVRAMLALRPTCLMGVPQ